VEGNVLEIDGLTLDYETPHGRISALREVSIDVPEETIVGIVGESGCGKSTVAAAAMRLLPGNAAVSAGEIRYAGQDLLKASERQLRALRGQEIAMVFQDPMTSQNPVIRVGRQMTDTLYRHGLGDAAKRDRAVAMLRKVGIADPEERFRQYPHEFSGGMRQRISIGMALLVNPRLLIADEPTTALDV
jgi:ABC-type dipeptide/oligopeptide/nickel transport system ATPase component